MELRMMGLVPYNISPIQQGIQFGHGVVEYGQMVKRLGGDDLERYNDWADNYKTFIILNGGTTNSKTNLNDGLPFGSLNNHLLDLANNGITVSKFYEPDLGDQLTSINFIVDERVFNKKVYKDFNDWLDDKLNDPDFISNLSISEIEDIELINNYSDYQQKISVNNNLFKEWVDFIGGDKNLFLREFLKNFRLA